jgi:RNA polymerase sigma factor for flagellar operon FliA
MVISTGQVLSWRAVEHHLDVDHLWLAFSKDHCRCHRDELILAYMPVVRRVAAKIWRRTPIQVDLEELVAFGVVGLIRAVDAFDPERGLYFETVGAIHIRGAILDELRKVDWAPRAVRRRQRELDHAMIELESDLGRVPTSAEVATKLGVAIEDVEERRSETSQARVSSLDERFDLGDFTSTPEGPEDTGVGLEDLAHTTVLYDAAEETLRGMSWPHKLVVTLYYFEGLSLGETARVMGVSENRVSDLHNGAVMEVRDSLIKYLDHAAA